MRIRLSDEHKSHCRALGIDNPPDFIECAEHEWEHAKSLWKKVGEDIDHDLKAIGHLAWQKCRTGVTESVAAVQEVQVEARKAEAVVEHAVAPLVSMKRVEGLLGFIALLLVLLLVVTVFSTHAHGQWSQIKTIQTCTSGDCVGAHRLSLHASPFTIVCGSNMTCVDTGTQFTMSASSTAGTAWDSITNPVSGGLSLTQFANGNTFLLVKRKTDTAPTGAFFDFQNAAGSSLCKLDITGAFVGCPFPYANLTGAPTLPANTTATASNFFTAYNSTTGAFTKARPACSDLSDSGALCTSSATIPADVSSKKYLIQTADAALPNAQAMGALGTGIVKNTTTTGVQSIAVAADFPTLNQDTTGSAAKVNGATVPVSANVAATNGSSQIIAATEHNVDAIAVCSAASASGTAYTCSTSPTFAPAAGDKIIFKADVANTASATLNVNASSAATIKKQGGGTNLVANDLLASQYAILVFDGTNWQMESLTGNAGAAGSSNPTTWASQGQTSASTTTTGAFCSSGLLLYTYTIPGGTLAAGDNVLVNARVSKSGTTDAPRYCLAVGGFQCTPSVGASTTDTYSILSCNVTVNGASAEGLEGNNIRNSTSTIAIGTLSAAISSNIVINVYAYFANSTDTVRGESFRVLYMPFK